MPPTTDCAAGYVCITNISQCLQWCKMPGGTCTSGTCQAVTSPPVVNGVTYGVCH